MKLLKILILVFFTTIYNNCYSQKFNFRLIGTVKNKDNHPIQGAQVKILKINKSTITDSNGYFSFNNLPKDSLNITISTGDINEDFTKKIYLKSLITKISFTLKKETKLLEDITVLGYSKVDITNRQAYNVTSIDAKKYQNVTIDIAHLLDKVPGARYRESGGVGSDFDFSINGLSGKRIKYFVDGIPIDNLGNSFQINNIPINFAEKIDVYKGVIPASLGSDALGGAVNIISNNKLKNFLDVSYSYGSFNTNKSNINFGTVTKSGFTIKLNAYQNYSFNNYKVKTNVANLLTGRYSSDTTVKRFHDHYHNEMLITQLGWTDTKWADHFLFGLTTGQYYKQIQTGARMDAVFGAWHTKGNINMPTLSYLKSNLFINKLNFKINANYNFGLDQSIDTVHARYNWLGDSLNFRGKGGESWHGYSFLKYKNNTGNVTASLDYSLENKHFFSLNNVLSSFDRKGYNAVADNTTSNNFPQKTIKNYLGGSYQFKSNYKWDVTLFAKYLYQYVNTTNIVTDAFNYGDTTYLKIATKNRKFGYGLAAAYYIAPNLQTKISFEKSNRLPESDDLFGDNINKEGNVDLKPESSNNLNLNINYNFPLNDHRLFFSATGIYYHANNFIYYNFNSYTNTLKAENLLNISNTGLETEIRYSFKQKFSLGINNTFQNIRDKQKYRIDLPNVLSNTYLQRIPNIPYLFSNANATLFFSNIFNSTDQMSIGYNLLYVHSFYLYWANEGASDTKRVIPQQLSHDLFITYSLKNSRYNFSIEGRNLTNRTLYDNYSLQKPGRSFSLKIRYFLNKS
jgi:outer membrane receptor protein involved in Fe transport